MKYAALTGTGLVPTTPTVLVVDDEESIRILLSRVLEQIGCTVLVAEDADSALEIMKTAPAHMAVVDIRMPGHDGIWLIERLSEFYPATVIIIATGVRDLDPRVTLRPGVAGYVVKPFVFDDVQKAVKHALASIGVPPPEPRAIELLPDTTRH